MDNTQFEQAWELIATAVNRAGPARERLFLARLALALTHRLPDVEALREALAIAADGLTEEPVQHDRT
jgi:hypothetical protein